MGRNKAVELVKLSLYHCMAQETSNLIHLNSS
jgi:hypothetical protein